MSTRDKALKLAQEGVEIHAPNAPEYIVCAALIEALAQPEQEPVGMYRNKCPDGSRCLHGCHTSERCFTSSQRKPLTDEQPMYYLQDTRGYVGNCPLWWGLNGNGYTTDLRKAQKYTLAKAMSQHRCRDSDLPWLCSEIDAIQRPTIDVQDMHKMRSVDDQRAALQAAHGIKEQP